jgi:hypothetical protein
VTLWVLLHERVNEPPHVIRMLVETMKTSGQPYTVITYGRNRRSDGTKQHGEQVRVWSALHRHDLIAGREIIIAADAPASVGDHETPSPARVVPQRQAALGWAGPDARRQMAGGTVERRDRRRRSIS